MPDNADYELRWPRDLFVAEAKAVLSRRGASWVTRFELLLTEAFRGSAPAEDFRGATSSEWLGNSATIQRQFADSLVAEGDRLREAGAPRPYWPARQGRLQPERINHPGRAQRDFSTLIAELEDMGYLAQVFPKPCVDDRQPTAVDRNTELAVRLGIQDLWPLKPDTWEEDTFYGLTEVFHDLVARPRERWLHEFGGCGWHYGAFALEPARRFYRWRVNRLLESAGIELRLAESGEDMGRLIQIVDTGRAELVHRALTSPDSATRGTVGHAIALFRGRNATEHDKRSAIVALASVLEGRRRLLKDAVFTKDEDSLFQIANQFALRHRNEAQKSDYDPVFLDWMFWWYLATVELTDRLAARPAPIARGSK